MSTGVVFISGSGRSGTNITKEILSRHSFVASLPFEHRFTIDPRGIVEYYRNIDNWSPYMVDYRLKELGQFLLSLAERNPDMRAVSSHLEKEGKTGHPYVDWELERWMPGYTVAVHQLIASLKGFEYQARYPGSEGGVKNNIMYYASPDKGQAKIAIQEFLEKCHNAVIKKGSQNRFIEDNTWSILFARDLLDLVPEGQMIHIVRDPRDVISSYQNQKWTPNKVEYLVVYYRDILKKWQQQRSMIDPSKYLEIRFEDLISEPEHTLSRICDRIGLQMESQLLNTDLSRNNIGRHKTALSRKDIDYIENELSELGAEYNYF